jgi:phosphatidylglycerol:prolipoprotein diacylglycerol transferase
MGGVFAAYLVLTGAARFLVEFIRINPRSFFGLTNAQAASAVSVIAGAALWWHVARRGDAPARR